MDRTGPVLIGVALVTALSAAVARAQPAGSEGVLARLRAVVTENGAPVADLTGDDLALVEDGVALEIEAVLPHAGPRVFGILLDEFHVSPGEPAAVVRESLAGFVRTVLASGDRIAIVRPMDSLSRIAFTEYPEDALAAIERFEGRRGDFTPRTEAEAQLLGRSPALVARERARIVRSALGALVAEVGRMDARGVVAVISEGFPEPGRGGRRADLQAVPRMAATLDVPVYGFAPLATRAVEAAHAEDAERDDGQAALARLARQTGGRASFDRASLPADLARMASDIDASYVLTYRRLERFDGRYHTLDLRATREGLDVLAQEGRWAPLGDPAVRAEAAPASPDRLVSYRSRPVHRSPFAETWVGLSRGSEGRMRVVVTWEPDRGPQWVRGGALASVARFRASRPDGTLLYEGRLAPSFGGEAGDPTAAIFETTPGPVELDMTLVDGRGRVLDVDSRDVSVPEPDEPRVRLMDPEIVRARTAVEFRALAADPDAPPSASRDFRRTERLILRTPAYDAGGAPLPVEARLLNMVGQVILELEPMPATIRGGVVQFDLSLAPYAPGTYEIEFVTRGATGQVRTRVRFQLTG